MTQIVKHIQHNDKGRDFIIGDLHGYYNHLDKLLAYANFDTTKDRLFSVGDIIDRGPDSLLCLTLLDEPWFHMVRGNHEQLMIEALSYPEEIERKGLETYWMRCGGQWWQKYSDEEKSAIAEAYLEKLSDLPYIITVGEGENRFNIVHSEFPSTILSDEDVDAITELDDHTKDVLIWSRTIFDGFGLKRRWSAELSPTFCGHTIVVHISHRLNHINIDTGLYYNMKLTMMDVNTLEYYQIQQDTYNITKGDLND